MTRCRRIAIVTGVCLLAGSASAAEATRSRLYEVTTDTGMPHLEENLRYARKVESRCLDVGDLSREFWMLDDVSLKDCKMIKTTENPDAAVYLLSCVGGHGTTGQATWQLGSDRVRGTLDVRLGGKNMTFYQRVTAKLLGRCP